MNITPKQNAERIDIIIPRNIRRTLVSFKISPRAQAGLDGWQAALSERTGRSVNVSEALNGLLELMFEEASEVAIAQNIYAEILESAYSREFDQAVRYELTS